MKFDRAKFLDLMHYIIWKAGDVDGFGATKLYKILWFSDARQYMLTGKPITGAKYIRETFGPMPVEGWRARKELMRTGKARIWKDRYYNKEMWRFKALTPPNLHGFSSEELKTVDWWIEHVSKDHTAASISEESHDYGWEIARMKEELPYAAFLASRVGEPTDEELEWGRQRTRELGLM